MDQTESFNLLVVDDEVDLKLLYKQKFRKQIKEGSIVLYFAHNGVEALETLEKVSDIAMVLSDINMPEMDGLTLLDRINDKYPDIITVVVSAYGDMDNIRSAMNLGAFDFLTKPINFDDLGITLGKTKSHIKQLKEAQRNKSQLTTILDELEVATNIQKSILPKEFYKKEGVEVHGLMEPAREVGGDFFDYFDIDDNHVGLVVGDVSGKGVPAALLMTVTRTLMRATGSDELSPAKVVKKVNDAIFDDNEELMFVTLFYAIVNRSEKKITYTNAGHEYPYLVGKKGKKIELRDASSVVLGIRNQTSYEEVEINYEEGDSLFIYSDGLTDAVNHDNDDFGEKRLTEKLLAYSSLNPNEVIDNLYQDVEKFSDGCDQFDDITMLVAHFSTGAESSCSNLLKSESKRYKISVVNDIKHLEAAIIDIETFLKSNNMDEENLVNISLISNEIISNVINYAYDDGERHRITFEMMLNNDSVVITTVDDGVPFNPVQTDEPKIDLPAEERDIGGLGIFLIKSFTEEMHYEREGNRNRFSVTVKIEE